MNVKPVYKFTYKNKIFIFGVLGLNLSKPELNDLLNRWAFIDYYDGTKIVTSLIRDVQVCDVECPVGLVLFPKGKMVKTY